MNNTIMKNFPESERPYERLEKFGVEALSNTELLAIVLKNGTKDKNVISLSNELLTKFGSLKNIFEATLPELRKVKGLGRVKSIEIRAIGELSKRILSTEIEKKAIIDTPEKLYGQLLNEFASEKREIVKVILLDKSLRIINEQNVFKGTLDQATIHPREIFSFAIRECSFALIIVHNHPSGSASPSDEDIISTKSLIDVGKIVGINVIDHIIVGKSSCYSFRNDGFQILFE